MLIGGIRMKGVPAMTFVFEISGPFQWRPGYYKGGRVVRVWWAWFALGWINCGFGQFCREVTGWDSTNQLSSNG
jgi:hypothetical protein